jgi:hypothetical protein
MLNDPALDHFDHLPTINEVPRKPIQLPTQDSARLSASYAGNHICEYGPPELLCGPGLLHHAHDLQPFTLREGFQLIYLRLDGENVSAGAIIPQ